MIYKSIQRKIDLLNCVFVVDHMYFTSVSLVFYKSAKKYCKAGWPDI